MKLSVTTRRLHPRQVFRISRASRRFVENVFVRLEHDGIAGWGEASPNAFYHETADDVARRLLEISPWLAGISPGSIDDLPPLWEELWSRLKPSRAAQCAVDLALWDWLARSQGLSVGELVLGRKIEPVCSFCTIGLSDPVELEAKLDEVHDFAAIKIKSDAEADLTPVQRARSRSAALLAVDANCAWPNTRILRMCETLQGIGVAFLEQPLPPAMDDLLHAGRYALPILADESCVLEEDVPRTLKHFDGFNIKLVKCGGLTPALRMAKQGTACGAQTMVGCMLESSLLISAGMVVAQRTAYADLDGAWLLADDPAAGILFDKGFLNPTSNEPGLGISFPHEMFV